MPRQPFTVLSLFFLTPLACSTEFHASACKSDVECGPGFVCDLASRGSSGGVCVSSNAVPLRIGMSAPITGPSQELGTEMKKGLMLAFDAVNAKGGANGRPIELEFRDDQYQPLSAEAAARSLLDVSEGGTARCPTTTTPVVAGDQPVATGGLSRGANAVLGLVGNVGTPTMVRSAPIAIETGSLFFGAFTGASKVLRDGMSGACARYIFNVRASYTEEAHATLEYFTKLHVADERHILSFDQNDSFGQAGYDGLVLSYTALYGPPKTTIPRFRYTRDDQSSVPTQITAVTTYLASLLSADAQKHVVGIFMTDTYGPATTFIKGVRDWQYANDAEQTVIDKATRLTVHFSNVSFVGANSLASRLHDAGTVTTPSGEKPYSESVYVSQVVPNYESDDSDGVSDYRAALADAGLTPSFTSLEGYLTGRVFAAGLVAHKGEYTPDALIGTFEHLPPLNLGLGATSGFSPDNHNYSKAIFGTAIKADGGFANSYFWSDGTPIQLFE